MTTFLTYCYLSYAFASPMYAGYQYIKGNFRAFHDFALGITVTAFIGYSGYLLLPAVGPYIYQHALYPNPLPNWGHGGILDVPRQDEGLRARRVPEPAHRHYDGGARHDVAGRPQAVLDLPADRARALPRDHVSCGSTTART